VKDDLTIRITLTRPVPIFLEAIARGSTAGRSAAVSWAAIWTRRGRC
jgi:hypothetical protein